VHEDGYGLKLEADGKPLFTAPGGQKIAAGPDTRFRGNVIALTAAHRIDGLDIGPRTIVPTWGGERMDDSMAVEALIQREQGPVSPTRRLSINAIVNYCFSKRVWSKGRFVS
jgi:hypothetical protein